VLYIVHDKEGRIEQANKHYDPEGYDKVLHDYGFDNFIKVNVNSVVSPDEFFVQQDQLTLRQSMPIVADRPNMVANKQGITFEGVPKGSLVIVSVSNMELYRDTINDGQAYLESPIPGIFRITFECWPWLTWVMDVECVA
jgi:hypothetical protein